MYSTIKVNDHTIAVVTKSANPENPLFHDLAAELAAGYSIVTIDKYGDVNGIEPVTQWQKDILEELYSTMEEGRVHEVDGTVRSLRASGIEIPDYVGVRYWKGRGNSEMSLIVSGPDEQLADQYYETWSNWALGDVHDLGLKRRCPVTGDWFISDLEERITDAIYESSRNLEEFEDTILAAAEANFDTKLEPVSPRGKEILRRRELRALISEEKLKLAHLADADVMEVANRIFALCDQLSREPVDN